MRECLGWLTNCPDDRRCPQNWLEYAATELPVDVPCHVCERSVRGVTTEAEFEEADQSGVLVTLPVVPCAGRPALYGPLAGAGGSPLVPHASVPAPGNAQAAAPSPAIPKAATETPRTLFCVLSSGEAIRIDKDLAVIGRSRTCDIIIASAKVSRQHANVVRQSGEFFIEDLGSANGVWQNGQRLGQRTKIRPGDVYTISEENLTFEYR